MRLAIISSTPYYRDPAGGLAGWGPTVRELDMLATVFDEVRHLTPVHAGPPHPGCLRHAAANVEIVAMPAIGGQSVRSRLGIFCHAPHYWRQILGLRRWADVVHVRCPDAVSLLALLALAPSGPRPGQRFWFKFAGNWQPGDQPEAWTYALERWWLRNPRCRAEVTVNGTWPGMPPQVHAFHNPSFSQSEFLAAGASVMAKPPLQHEMRLLFVGRLTADKGAERAMEITAMARAAGIPARLDLVGSGPDEPAMRIKAADLGLTSHLCFHGWLPRPEIEPLYARTHLLLLPSAASEGWPKVIGEAMAHGVVPVAGNISCIADELRRFGCGQVLAPTEVAGFAAAIAAYWHHPERLEREARLAHQHAQVFTYENYRTAVKEMLGLVGEKLK